VRSRWARLQPQKACELQLFVEAVDVVAGASTGGDAASAHSEMRSYLAEFRTPIFFGKKTFF
jgi:hypothetical protein